MSIRDRLTDPQLIRDINCGILDGLRLRHGLALGHVLLVEADPTVRRLLSGALRRAGYHVSTATDADGGQRAARHVRPDLILVDIVTPDGDGLAAVAALRTAADGAKLAAYCGDDRFAEHLDAAFTFGADDVVDEPAEAANLLRVVRDLLELPARDAATTRPRKGRRKAG